MVTVGPLLSFFHKAKIKELEGLGFFLELGDEPTSKFIWVVGQTQFFGETPLVLTHGPFHLKARHSV